MLICERLETLSMTKYRLSKESGVPLSTINDLCSGKTAPSKCSSGTLYRVAKVLGITMEEILEEEQKKGAFVQRTSFETFKSNTCHYVKEMGDLEFMLEVVESDRIRTLYEKQWYPECLYLLAMIDYLSREHHIPLCKKYDDLRTKKLDTILYPEGVLLTAEVFGSEAPLREARKKAIPEFERFNIIESEVRDVV